MTALALALAVPWAAGVLLVPLDGRRRVVGWLAVGALAAQLVALVGLAAQVLPGRAVHFVTGGWPADVGIVLRADSLGIAFALVSAVMLLAALAQHPGQTFSREQLLDRLHGVVYEGFDRSVDSHIKNLRRKVEPDPLNPTYVLTVYGVGYKFTEEGGGESASAKTE